MAIGVCMMAIWYFRFRCRAHDNIPMFHGWNIFFGHLLLIHRNYERANEWLYDSLQAQGWPKVSAACGHLLLRTQYGIALQDPEVVRFVFETKFASFKKGERIQAEGEELFGDGIFVADPPRWNFHRKVASRMFSMVCCTTTHIQHIVINKHTEESQELYV